LQIHIADGGAENTIQKFLVPIKSNNLKINYEMGKKKASYQGSIYRYAKKCILNKSGSLQAAI